MLRMRLSQFVRQSRFPWLVAGLLCVLIVVTVLSTGCVSRSEDRSRRRPEVVRPAARVPQPLREKPAVTDDVFVKPKKSGMGGGAPQRSGETSSAAAEPRKQPPEAPSHQQQPPQPQSQQPRSPPEKRGGSAIDDFAAASNRPITPTKPKKPAPVIDIDPENERRREAVKEMMQHAWNGYRKYAWGHDELRPVSKTGMQWLGLGASIVDSLDTLWIMGLKDEFQDARNWVEHNLNFNQHIEVSVFETTIRVLGGLCAAYDLSGDAMFLRKADELASVLSWAFNTSSGIPYASLNFATHQGRSPGWTGGSSILAEMGTLQLEFKHVARHTGNMHYYNIVERVIDHLDRQPKSTRGLYPMYVNPHSGTFTSSSTSFGALGDSFYEYLIKQWWFHGKPPGSKYKRMYEETVDAVLQHLIKESSPNRLTYIAEWSGSGPVGKMDHLACFVGGMLAMGAQDSHRSDKGQRELEVAQGIGETCYQFYARQPTGLSPELVHFGQGNDFVNGAGHYIQRPEAVETFFYLWRFTKQQKWRDHGWKIVEALNANSRTDAGFAGLREVTIMPPMHDDQQQSFFLAETLKYLYLLFCDDSVIPLDEFVFNTEAHPLRRVGPVESWGRS